MAVSVEHPKMKRLHARLAQRLIIGIGTLSLMAFTVSKFNCENYVYDVIYVNSMSDPKNIVNPHPYDFTILETGICISKRPLVVAAVISAPTNFAQRKMIRNTWGSVEYFNQTGLVAVFFVGSVKSRYVQRLIEEESQLYHDVVQENFKDDYFNLTLKSVMVLKWVAFYCSEAKFMLKVDEDVFVDSFRLSNFLDQQLIRSPNISKIICRRFDLAPIHRKESSDTKINRWSIHDPKYTRHYHPPYCNGPAYIFTTNLVQLFYNASLFTRFIILEDVFITGLVQETLGSNYISHVPEIHYLYKKPFVPVLSALRDPNIIFIHLPYSNDERYRAWKELTSNSRHLSANCHLHTVTIVILYVLVVT